MELVVLSKKEFIYLDYLIHNKICFLNSEKVKARKSIKENVKSDINLLVGIREKLSKIVVDYED